MNVSRSEIKHNFLKQIIFRLDFEGLLEADVERCVLDLRQKFFDAGFRNMEKRVENQLDLQIKMGLNILDENSINNANKSLVYRFLSDNNEVLEVGKSFFTLTVDIDKEYETFDKYVAILAESVNKIRNVSPYFRALRIGLRKINICFLNNLYDLTRYFTRAAFNIDDIKKQFPDCECGASNMVAIMTKEGYQINYVRNVQEGVMQQEDGSQSTTYQIVLDVDVFMENSRQILPMLVEKNIIEKTLNKQNSIEFDIFINSLSEEFVELLKNDTFENDTIGGVI